MLFAGFFFAAEINKEHSLICLSVSLPATTRGKNVLKGDTIVSLSRENGLETVKKEAELVNILILLSCVKILRHFIFLHELVM